MDAYFEALEQVFAENPLLRGYLLDDQSRLRKHVIVFVDDAVATGVSVGDSLYVPAAIWKTTGPLTPAPNAPAAAPIVVKLRGPDPFGSMV